MASSSRRSVLLLQLPIPPLGPLPFRGNIPLAAGYLKLYAESKGLGESYTIDILPAHQANTLGDRALVAALAERDPWMVGFTCYLWNIERTLWIAHELKRCRPGVRIVLGGPEITADNDWVLQSADYDFAVIGEGEQTFAELLQALLPSAMPEQPIAGLYVSSLNHGLHDPAHWPAVRVPLANLDELCSPYLAGILDVADEQMMLLETTRGCIFNCKFCYYPKNYDRQYFLSHDRILASLQHADERSAREVFLLDPTLNQRNDFADFLRLLARANPVRRFTYSGELRAEGITRKTALLLREANFTEVEVGLQSVEPDAQQRMDRKNNLKAFARGVRAMLDEDISVKVDMIIGLPGDTVESVRRGLHFLHDNGLYSDVQIFNLSILPGTAFRQEAVALGLEYQSRPPYCVLKTPTLDREAVFALIHEAQELFGIEFDAQPDPVLDFAQGADPLPVWRVNLDESAPSEPAPASWAQAFTLWFSAQNLNTRCGDACKYIRRVLDTNPFTTLQAVLQPSAIPDPATFRQAIPTPRTMARLMEACYVQPTYLDRFYAFQPGQPNGAKRLIVVLPENTRCDINDDGIETLEEYATIVWS